jgi:hypothetical protein
MEASEVAVSGRAGGGSGRFFVIGVAITRPSEGAAALAAAAGEAYVPASESAEGSEVWALAGPPKSKLKASRGAVIRHRPWRARWGKKAKDTSGDCTRTLPACLGSSGARTFERGREERLACSQRVARSGKTSCPRLGLRLTSSPGE